jgi:hypothetical protein
MKLGSTTINKAYLGGNEVRKINRGAVTIHTGPPLFFTGTPPAGVDGEGFVPLTAPDGLNAYALGYSEVINPELVPLTASIVRSSNGQNLTLGSFQPIQYRNRFTPLSNSANTVALTYQESTFFDSWREGLLDGGEVRVWRIVSGVMTLVRTSAITKHRASGWFPRLGSNTIVPAGTTSFAFNFQPWNRPSATQWISVCSINSAGDQSAPATAASYTTPASWPSTPAGPSNTTSAKTLTNVTDGGISAPTGVVVTPSNGGMTVTVSWDAVGGVAGYIVLMSDYDPAEHLGHGLDLAPHATPIVAGDIVFAYKTFREIDRAAMISNRQWTSYLGYYRFSHEIYTSSNAQVWGEEAATKYTLEDHDIGTSIPGKGQTYARITVPSGQGARISRYNHASMEQEDDFYPVLNPAKTYRVECWMKADASRAAIFNADILPQAGPAQTTTWNVTTSWQLFSYEFSVENIRESTYGTSLMRLELGEGVWDVDSVFVFEKDSPHLGATPELISRTSGLSALRFHEHSRTGVGTYGLDQITNAHGRISCRAAQYQTYHSLLQLAVDCGVNPWMQIEMHFTPDEWDGFLQYLAGTTGEWAAKRIANGRTAPWTDAFDTIYFEISNETWNSLFGPWTFPNMTDSVTSVQYNTGEVYGIFQEYVIDRLKSSALWTPELEGKFKFMLGGWGVPWENSFTTGAIAKSPNSDFMTIAIYNGGWEAGAGVPTVGNPQSYRAAMAFAEQGAAISIGVLKDATGDLPIGTYEAGPGYVLNGLNGVAVTSLENQSQERVMKSKSGGVSTIDTFLLCAQEGMAVQNYFTLSNGQKWTSHAQDYRGGAAFPAWKYVELFNTHCSGLNMVGTQLTYGPKTNIPAMMLGETVIYAAIENADDVAFYVFRGGGKLCLWAISRKLPWDELPVDDDLYDAADDGITTAHIRLPINSATTVKRYRMSGNYDQHNTNPDAFLIFRQLNYDGGTIAFTPGSVSAGDVAAEVTGSLVTGATSGATAQIFRVTGTTASGTLDLFNVQGTFQDNENLLVAGVPNAVANGTIGNARAANVFSVNDPLYADLQIAEETLVVSDVQNFTLPGGIPPASADLYVFEGVSNASFSADPSVSQVVITPTEGVWPLEFSWSSDPSAYPLDSITYEIRRNNVVVATQSGTTYTATVAGTYTVRPIVTSGAQTATFSEAKMLALYNGEITGGRVVVSKPVLTDPVSAFSGATKTSQTVGDDGFDIYTFDNTAGGSITFSALTPAQYLIVAGGGGGGAGQFHQGGGGGAGGLLEGSTMLAAGTYPVTVGVGGDGSTNTVHGTNGGNSAFNGLTAIGGGVGGHRGVFINGQLGGSGGGCFNNISTAGSGAAGQGNNGGRDSSPSTNFSAGGGGGGAGAAGGDPPVVSTGGAGGDGLESDITGTAIYYAGGGGGAGGSGGIDRSGAGGLGGGGAGTYALNTGNDGTDGLGGGGGGINSGSTTHLSGAGGSGVVIIRVQVA